MQSNHLVIPYLCQCEISLRVVCVLVYICVSVHGFFSRFEEVQRRQRSGPAGICRQTHFPLSLTHTDCLGKSISVVTKSVFSFSFEAQPWSSPFPLILFSSSVIGPFTGQWRKETYTSRSTYYTSTHSQPKRSSTFWFQRNLNHARLINSSLCM